jgi:hypothetical protein
MFCRSDKAWKAIFEKAGLTLVREQVQEGLPEGLYEVKMWVSSGQHKVKAKNELLLGTLCDNVFKFKGILSRSTNILRYKTS